MNKNSKKAMVGKDAKKQKDLAKAKSFDSIGKAAKVKGTKPQDPHKCYTPVKGKSNWPCCNGSSTIMKK